MNGTRVIVQLLCMWQIRVRSPVPHVFLQACPEPEISHAHCWIWLPLKTKTKTKTSLLTALRAQSLSNFLVESVCVNKRRPPSFFSVAVYFLVRFL